MKFRLNFEHARSNLMNRDPLPSLDICLGELSCEEHRSLTQETLEHKVSIGNLNVAYTTHSKHKGLDMINV